MEEGNLKGQRLLLVENDEIFILVMERYLEKWGCNFTIAQNGQEAIDIVKQVDIDIILMDQEMPVMNGNEAAKIIKTELGNRFSNLPIIAFSGDDTTPIDSNLFDGFISKSTNQSEMLRQLIQYLN